MVPTTFRRMPAEKYIALVTKIVAFRRAGLTFREIDERFANVYGEVVKSQRWLSGPKTRAFAKQLGA